MTIKWLVRLLAAGASALIGVMVASKVMYAFAVPIGRSISGGEIREPGGMALVASAAVFLTIVGSGAFAGTVLSERLSGRRG